MARSCTDPVCSGTFEAGFCDTCGRAEPAETTGPSASTASSKSSVAHIARQGGYARQTGRVISARRPSANGGTAGTAAGAGGSVASRSQRSRGSTSRRRALGGGLVQMPVEPSTDPLKMVMADPRVPDGMSVCPSCGNRVNPDKRFCSNCGVEYDFRPSLRTGDILADQYDVKGPIAFGGLGWIYLAMDTRLNRWVVLKGLLNTKDAAAAAAAVAERQFLAAVKHGKIVGIYTFVTHGTESFIVMEYVGGRTLKAIRRERGPLPPAEAMAFILGILPAFAYLHEQNLVYCDFKPDNVMLESDDVKLIDLGAVRRIGDPDGDIYGTLGFKAPEADQDPDSASDLFTIGRALAVLLMDFDNTGRFVATLPPPNDILHTVPEALLLASGIDATQMLHPALKDGSPLPAWLRWSPSNRTFAGSAPPGVTSLEVRLAAEGRTETMPVTLHLPLAANESLYRLLLKATAKEPAARFGSAEEMSAQLAGVLRETVARDAPVPVMESAVFLGEQIVPGDPMDMDSAWRRLPTLRLMPADPAAAAIFAAAAAAPAARNEMLAYAVRAFPGSSEARLRRADALIDTADADVDVIMALLDQALAIDPFDWRPDWYCGRLYLSLRRAEEAVECFDKVYGEVPGELAPKLALALALETEGRVAEAAGLYGTVCRTDPMLPAAAFGLARCLLNAGERDGAVAALAGIPDSVALSAEARLAAVRVLSEGDPGEKELRLASDILARLERRDIVRHDAEAAVALVAAQKVESGVLPANGAALLGVAVTGRALREKAETALRLCARMSDTLPVRIAYVDRANAVRPRTLV